MNLPERIYAIGGAGKAITYELLEADWVQEEILEPRPNPKSLTVTLVDTAEDEINDDEERIKQIRADIRETKERLREESSGRPGEITIDYLPLTRNIQLHDQNDLIGESVIPRIADGVGMDRENWWLRPEYINENLNFATGVVRKRGLGKGLYYKAYAEDDEVRTQIDLPSRGKVAVIAGLGGGSGSGMFIDLVQHLKRTQRTAEITLFGVLPNDAEGDAENANAHAALSELEYLSLQGEDVFKDRVLMPIDPTDFGGKKANILQSSDALVEFDRAAVYLIVSYFNKTGMEDPFADMPSYAPFIIGIPQVLRYNVDAIKGAKTKMTDLLSEKQDALEAEEEIYGELDRFFARHFDDGETGELHDSDRSDLKNRFDSLESLLEVDLFEELGYESISIFREIIGEARNETEDVAEQVEIVSSSIRAGTASLGGESEQFVDSIDKELADIIRSDIRNLGRRKELLEDLRRVDAPRIQSTLSYLLALDDEGINAGVRLNQLEAKREDAEERMERLESDLAEVREELEEKRDTQRQEIERRADEWERAVRMDFEDFQACQDISIESRVGSLETAIGNFSMNIDNATDPEEIDNISSQDVTQALNTLSDELEAIGIDISSEEQDIQSSVRDLAEAKKSFLKMNSEEGTVEKILPWESSAEEERQQARKNYRTKRNQLDDKGVFAISSAGSNLSIEVEYDGTSLIDRVKREEEQRRDQIIMELREQFDENGPQVDSAMQKVGTQLDRGRSLADVKQIVEDALTDVIVDTGDISERKDDLEADLEDARGRAELFSATVSLFEEINNRRETFVNSHAEYNRRRSSYGEERSSAVSTEEEEYRYMKTVRPNDILQIRDDSDIDESGIFDDEAERQRLRSSLEELARNIHNSKYSGLRKRRISSSRARYEDMQIAVGAVSQAIDQIGEEAARLQEIFAGAYNLGPGEENYASYPVDAGGNWDIGLGVFIGGIFLDNLRAEAEADGYREGYRAKLNSDELDILVHHTYGLEEGFYVRRNDVLNLENPDDIEFFLRDEASIREDLLQEYIEVVPTKEGNDTPDEAIEYDGPTGDLTDGGRDR
ncbi:tubulin-like doman-containing protein [Halobaculum limi]|uniref:tubulin-like doman-containing protein n=1 Tax=Halobaculum limi TaxID=3031916 RepID=UPI0024071BCA|nr:tubulin-like doman-containing protein [Halobaculum sp. YSMS11]